MAYNSGASSGNLVLIQEQAVSAVATVNFTDIPAAYDDLKLVYSNINGSAAGTYIRFQISYDNGATYKNDSNYNTSAMAWDSAGIQSFYVAGETSGRFSNDCINVTTGQVAGQMIIYGANNSGANQAIINNGASSYNAFSTWQFISAYIGSLGAINAFQVFANSGTISGTFKLYGVQN